MKISSILFLLFCCLTAYTQQIQKANHEQTLTVQLIAKARTLAARDTLQARLLLKRALDLSLKNKFNKSSADIYSIYGEMAATANRYKEGLAYVKKAMAIYVADQQLVSVAAMNNNLGNIYERLGDLKLAAKHGMEAIKIYRQLRDRAGEAKTMMNVGTIFFQQLDYKTALDYEFKALKIREELKNEEDLMYSYGVIGTMYQYMKKEKESIVFNKKSLAVAQRLKLPDNIGIYNVNIAKALIALNQNKQANPYFLAAIPAFKQVGNIRGLRQSYEGLATLAEKAGQVDEAISWQNKAIEIFKNGDDAYAALALYMNRHSIYMLQKNYKAAENDLLTSERIAKEQKMVAELPQIKQLQLNVYFALGDTKKAKAALDEFIKYKDSTLNTTSLQQINELKTKYETEEKENQLNKSKLLLVRKENEARKRNLWLFGITGFTLLTVLASFYIYRQQLQKHRLKTALLKIESENKLHEQRLDISRNLHDNIGSQLTFINSFMETLKIIVDTKNEAIATRINNISSFTKDAISELRDTVWALNSDKITFDDLRQRIFNYIEKAQSATENIDFKFEVDENLENSKFSSAQGINLYRTIQEAVNNAIKYANATAISIETRADQSGIVLLISDNGIGFDPQMAISGNGIYNMQKRVEEIGGEFKISAKVGQGTTIQIILKQTAYA